MLAIDAANGDPFVLSAYTCHVNLTSLARTGLPSCHRAAGSSENLIASESADHVQLRASCGRNPPSPTVFIESPTDARRSYTRSPIIFAVTVDASGGSRVSGSPLALMTSVPPCSAGPVVLFSPLQPTINEAR